VHLLARMQIDEIFIIDPEPRRFWRFCRWVRDGAPGRRRPSASSR